jgi:phosphoglycerol transferase
VKTSKIQAATLPNALIESKRWIVPASAYLITALLCTTFLLSFYNLWHFDLRIPINRPSDDYLVSAAMIKDLLETGSYWVYPRLGAPFGSQLYDFPTAEGFHVLLTYTIGLFTKDFVVAINLIYIFGYVLSSLSALFVFRQMRLPVLPSIGASLLFAFLPYHYVRGEYHLFLSSYYSIPLCTLLLIWLSSREQFFTWNEPGRFNFTRKGLAAISICVLLGASGVYYAFFSVFFLIVVALSCISRSGKLNSVIPSVAAILILSSSLVGNLAPSIIYHLQYGPNKSVAARIPAEAELFGLRISNLLLPITQHRIASLALLKATADSYFGPTTEATGMVALGVIGSVGFVILLTVVLFRPFAKSPAVLQLLATLNLAALLLATIGGGSALFSLFISSGIRAYARISIFIAFFSFFGLLIIVEKLRPTRLKSVRSIHIYNGVIGILILAGILDLTPAHQPLPATQIFSFLSDRQFVRSVEASLPSGALVFQLPYTGYPEAPAVFDLGQYDHLRGFLYSRNLRWSFGAMRGRESDVWEANTAGLPLSDMISAIRKAGFKGIYVDRFGYSDRGTEINAHLSNLLAEQPMESTDKRLLYFGLH